MTRYQRHHWLLAAALAGLAGFVDAIGFLETGGYFTAFMSGNSTRMAVGVVEGTPVALVAGTMIATFVGGVTLGAVIGSQCSTRARLPVTVALVGGLLGLAAAFAWAGMTGAAIGCTLLAMGAENTAFQREGQVSIGLTYMTGTLVKLGQALARVHRPEFHTEWLPYLLLWLGLVSGALLGATAFHLWGLGALWSSALLAMALAAVASLPRFAMD